MESRPSPATPPPHEAQQATSCESHKTPSPKKNTINGSDTPLRSRRTTTEEYRASGLDDARRIVRQDIGHVICLPIDHLWTHCPTGHTLDGVKAHLAGRGWLVGGKWNPEKVSRENVDGRRGLPEHTAFKPLSDIFNEILAYPPTAGMKNDVQTMVHAGSTTPKSDRISTNRPDAFLLMSSGLTSSSSDTSAADTSRPVHWRDLTCPFEYKLGDGKMIDNQDKLIWSLHHGLRSDPRRAFSFGVTVDGTKLRVWFGCRIALFNFPSIDWLESPDLLIKFFIFLAFSKESELGFDTQIERVNYSDFQLHFLIQGTDYLTSRVLYDVGADAMCGRGTWVFEAYPQGQVNPMPCVIKDCWVENRDGKEMEHVLVEKVRAAIGRDKFCEYFVDVCGYRRSENEALNRFCSLLSDGQFDVQRNTRILSGDGKVNHSATYSQLGQAFVDGQEPHLQLDPGVTQPGRPHLRFRYQIVYAERGTSLYDITSLSATFGYLVQVTDGLLILHRAGFVHRDLSPGNIIVVGGKAKISDLEFVKARKISDLQELTKQPEGSSVPVVVDTRTGTVNFAAIEAVEGSYYFRPTPGFGEKARDQRIFLYTPLHDYEAVWWIATWVVFSCTLKTVHDEHATRLQRKAKGNLLSNRSNAFARDAFATQRDQLPKQLHPLFDILEGIRVILLGMYSTYERDFNGTRMLDVVPPIVAALRDLVKAADGIEIEPLHVPLMVDRSEDTLIHMPSGGALGEGRKTDESGDHRGARQMDTLHSHPQASRRKRRRGGSMGPDHPDAKRKMVDYES